MRLGSSLFFFGLLVACGGGTVSVGTDRSAGSGDSTSGGSTSGGSGSGSGSCSTNADCPTNETCAFPSADACGAKGKCFDVSAVAVCQAYSPGCACDGTEINVACTPFPQGYVEKPLAHAGQCNVASDAGPTSCVTDSDCGEGFQCGYPEADACSAKGTCFDVHGMAACAAYSPGCACDGTEINVTCLLLPAGYYSKPLSHKGACK